MTETLVRADALSAPVVTPIKGTLLDVATIVENIKMALPAIGLYESYNCITTDYRATWPCPAGTIPAKTFENPAWPEGARFTVYAGAECKKFGGGGAEQLAALSKVFHARESFGVEHGLADSGTFLNATDLTPAGGAVSAVEAVGLLEGDAAVHYAGVPTIHLPRAFATPLFSNGAMEWMGNALMTKLGSKVAAGGGYDATNLGPDGAPAPAGQMWVYATGEVLVQRAKIIEVDALDRDTNDNLDLVERTYIVSVDCYKSAVLAKVA